MGTPNQNSCQFEVCIRRKKIISQSWHIPDPPASYFYNSPIFRSMDEKSLGISQPWETPHQSAFPPITPLCAYPTQHYPSMPASSGTLLAQLDILYTCIYIYISPLCQAQHYPSTLNSSRTSIVPSLFTPTPPQSKKFHKKRIKNIVCKEKPG